MSPEAPREPVPPPLPGVASLLKIRETPQSVWYRAQQERLGREVLLKVRSLEGGGALAVARAREEMLLLSKLHHDALAAAIDISAQGGWLYQMVELPPGEPLTRAAKERARSPWEPAEALAIAARLAEALEHAHRSEIVLRRLHPEDIFLAPDGRAKIASLEWASGPGANPSVPPDLNWIAPELAGGGQATPAADTYVLGLLLAWLLTLREPPASGLRRADEKALEALRARGAREEVVRLVGTLLDPDPRNRPARGVQALEAIGAVQRSLATRRFPARATVLAAAGLVVLTAAAGGIALLVQRSPTDGSPRPAARPAPRAPGPAASASAAPPLAVEPAPPSVEKPSPPRTAPEPAKSAGATPAPVSAADPIVEDARRAAEEELRALAARLEAEPEPWARAAADLEAFLESHPEEPVRSQAQKRLQELRASRALAGRRAMEGYLARDLPSRLAVGDFAGLAGLLDGLSERFPTEGERIAGARADLEALQSQAVRRLLSEVEGVLAGGEIARAEALAAERARFLLPASAGEVRATLAARIERARHEEELSRRAREAIERGIDRTIAGKSAVRSRLGAAGAAAAGTGGEVQELIIDSREGLGLAVHRRGSRASHKISALDLEPAVLLAMAGEAPDPAALREGLLLLYLGTGRPDPAARLLEDPAFSAAARAGYGSKLPDLRARLFAEGSRGAARRVEELRAHGGSPAEWTALRDAAAALVQRNAREPHYAQGSREAEAAFVAAAREALRTGAPANLFRGKLTREGRDGPVRVLYDFRDAGQIQDWSPLGSATRAEHTGRMLRLSGAVRLLSGSPFVGRARLVAMLPEKGYAHPPALGLILGLREEPKPGKGGPLPAAPPAAIPPAIAFVIGYNSIAAPLEIAVGASSLTIAMPANAVFACQGAFPAPSEALWAAPAGRWQGPLYVQTEIEAGQLVWNLNGRAVLSSIAEAALRKLASRFPSGGPEQLRGSVAVSALSEPLVIEAIEVGGALDPEWVEARLEAVAREELAVLKS